MEFKTLFSSIFERDQPLLSRLAHMYDSRIFSMTLGSAVPKMCPLEYWFINFLNNYLLNHDCVPSSILGMGHSRELSKICALMGLMHLVIKGMNRLKK